MNQFIGFYDRMASTKESGQMTIRAFMKAIKNGEWREYAEKAQQLKGARLKAFKKTVPAVTISGTFKKGRRDTDLIKHSDFICIDVDSDDNADVLSRRKLLQKDPYVCGYFRSISGKGLAIIFKIRAGQHRAIYEGISQYLEEKYNLKTDPTCKNVSRIRFVSWDPDCYWKAEKPKFTKLPESSTAPAEDTIYDIRDIEELVEVAEEKRKDLMSGYHNWYRIGQALASFGEAGRPLFHRLSAINKKEYNERQADRQYNACLQQEANGLKDVRITPGTIFYMAKLQGVLLKKGPTYVSGKNQG